MNPIIIPSSDLRNHYGDISKKCREERTPVVITVNGRGDTVLMNLTDYYNQQAELELFHMLAEAEEDVKSGKIAPIQNTFDDLRAELMQRGSHE